LTTRRRSLAAGLAVFYLIGLLGGCGTTKATAQPLPGGIFLGATKSGRADGTPIRLDLVRPGPSLVSYMAPGSHVYSLYYWSRGQRTQAYLDVPPGRGPFPLLIELHGGSFGAMSTHFPLPVFFQTTTTAVIATQPSAIVFLPNYVGYGPSRGKVGDAHQDFLDVRSGLAAVAQVRGLRVKPHATYLFGESLGGAIGAMLANGDPSIRAAAFVSPWPGATQALNWWQAHATALNADERSEYQALAAFEAPGFGEAWFRANSFGCRGLQVPVLLIGGTQDDVVPPGMLAAMAVRLKGCGAHVELKFVPGGHAPYDANVQALIQAWFASQGATLQF